MGLKESTTKGIKKIREEAKVLKGEKSKNKTYSTTREFTDEGSASLEFPRVKERLFDVNAWSSIPGIANAVFELHRPDGKFLRKNYVDKGDFIRIDLPGPLPFYWVRVTDLSASDTRAEFMVQPTYDPTERDDKTVTDHFFKDQARSIFRVERNGREITAMEIGLDEAINNEKAEAGEKGLINTLVSAGGWAVLQKYQWKNLTDYLVGIRTPLK